MLKIFALFLFLFSSLFSMSITYASITIDKPIVQQIQYEEQTQQYNSIYIKYNDKEITIPCVMKKRILLINLYCFPKQAAILSLSL